MSGVTVRAGGRSPLLSNWGFLLGAFIVGACAIIAVVVPWIMPHDPFQIDLNRRLLPPSWMEGGVAQNFMGTDGLGRDYFSRLLYGTRISMLIGVLTVITSGLIGITLGVVGGF